MRHPPPIGIFKPTPSRSETKSDMTARMAREIITSETKKRDAKTKRLRAARLAAMAAETS